MIHIFLHYLVVLQHMAIGYHALVKRDKLTHLLSEAPIKISIL